MPASRLRSWVSRTSIPPLSTWVLAAADRVRNHVSVVVRTRPSAIEPGCPVTPAIERVLKRVGRVDLADRVAEVHGVAGAAWTSVGAASGAVGGRDVDALDLRGQVAGGVERDPAVQADDHEGEQRLVEPAARVGRAG